MVKLSVVPERGDSGHISSVDISVDGRLASMGLLMCREAGQVIAAFVDHIESAHRQVALTSDGQFYFELKLTRLRTGRHRIRVARGEEPRGAVSPQEKVIFKADVEPDDLRAAVEMAERLYRESSFDPDEC